MAAWRRFEPSEWFLVDAEFSDSRKHLERPAPSTPVLPVTAAENNLIADDRELPGPGMIWDNS